MLMHLSLDNQSCSENYCCRTYFIVTLKASTSGVGYLLWPIDNQQYHWEYTENNEYCKGAKGKSSAPSASWTAASVFLLRLGALYLTCYYALVNHDRFAAPLDLGSRRQQETQAAQEAFWAVASSPTPTCRVWYR